MLTQNSLEQGTLSMNQDHFGRLISDSRRIKPLLPKPLNAAKLEKNGIFSDSLKLPNFSGEQGDSRLMLQNRIQTKVDAYMKCLELENLLIFLVCRKKLKTIGSVMYSSPERLAGMSQPTVLLHIAH